MERRFGVPLERRHGEVEGRAESEQGVKHRDEHREEVLEEDKENDEAQDAELTKVEDPRRSSKKEVKKEHYARGHMPRRSCHRCVRRRGRS